MGSDETDLVRFLSVRDAACPRCQYNLRGLQGTACPECGAEVSVERLQADETHRRWRESRMPGDPITIAGLIGSLLGMGLPGALLTLALLMREARELGSGWAWFVAFVVLVQLGIVVTYLVGMMRMKSWPRRGKLALAIAAWAWGPVAVLMLALWGMKA